MAALCAALCVAIPARAAVPTVPGFIVEDYAVALDPWKLSFDASGALFVGRDNRGSGGADLDSVKIHRIPAGGGAASEFGVTTLFDPDAILIDHTGALSGTAGSVLVGSKFGATGNGFLFAIAPDQSITTLINDTTDFADPADMALDGLGRLLIADQDLNQVVLRTAGVNTTLFSLPAAPRDLAINAMDLIFTSSNDGLIRIHDSTGALVDGAWSAGLGTLAPIEFGPGGAVWGDSLYSMSGAGDLIRFDAAGNQTIIGTGFGANITDIEFGPGNALYLSSFDEDKIIRVLVPEPGTSLLLVMGAAAALFRRRRPGLRLPRRE
ncbi:MAG: PEP-CTERM sorting domain-containing protein [Phycisphaerae bacterium]